MGSRLLAVVFWSFSSERNRLDSAAEALTASEKELAEVHATTYNRACSPTRTRECEFHYLIYIFLHLLSALRWGPLFTVGSTRPAGALARIASTKSTLTELQAELEAYASGACNPVKMEERLRAFVVLAPREAALPVRGTCKRIIPLVILPGSIMSTRSHRTFAPILELGSTMKNHANGIIRPETYIRTTPAASHATRYWQSTRTIF
jgi:hypothetical protein